ncbi:hypothetical protein A7978_04555 (plasmid) [Borrelia turicatae]|uniref:Uncharacterized protein n=1 Tax=Borrelia turicatae TaxID=142 RepID=A0A172XCH5_BORTU|nr:hypothetical protein [Borrelia turicatae]ANF34385.1 hypothetical protein A7978_04555 [Borrelia turicatae]UPA15462.1 hypothetical protein btBTE5EL_001142 [Borrelia turicatae]
MKRFSVVWVISVLSLFLMMCMSCTSGCESFLGPKAHRAYSKFKSKVDTYRSKLVAELESVHLDSVLLFKDQTYSSVLLLAEEDSTKRSIITTLGNDSKVIERLREVFDTLDLKNRSNSNDIAIAVSILNHLTSVTNLAITLFHKHLSKRSLARIRNSFLLELGLVDLLDEITSYLDQFIQGRDDVMSKIRRVIKTAAAKRGDKSAMINYLKTLSDDQGDLSKEILVRLVDNVFKIEFKLKDTFKWDS